MDQRDSSRMGSKREATLAVEYHQKNINASSGFYPQSLEDHREVFKEGNPWRIFNMTSPSSFSNLKKRLINGIGIRRNSSV